MKSTLSTLATLSCQGVEFILPTDVIIADKFAPDADTKTVSINDIPDGWMVRSSLSWDTYPLIAMGCHKMFPSFAEAAML